MKTYKNNEIWICQNTDMNKQGNKSTKKQGSIEAMFYHIAEIKVSINIIVQTYICIVVWKYRYISAKKQKNTVVNH